jgi:hypothetical protein
MASLHHHTHLGIASDFRVAMAWRAIVASCESKSHAFPSKSVAKTWARRFHAHGLPLARPYRCLACGRWHLTTASAEEIAHFRRRARFVEVA